MDTDKLYCRIIFDVLARHGVKDVVCSPGSRNAPLIIAAASREELHKHIVVDERSGAFMGLGISLVSRNPVALVCTSGTALLNYAPAVAEAYYQGIPLIVISADRPIQWIDQDDSQTLRQNDALVNYVKKSFTIPAYGENNAEMQWYVNRIANEAILVATAGKAGPVHINIQLTEPLGGKVNLTENNERLIREIKGDTLANKEIFRELDKKLNESRVLLVAGFMSPDSKLNSTIVNFCTSHPNVAVMAESISNLHLTPDAYAIDNVLTAYPDETLDEMAPDLVISLGGALVSRKLKEYLRRNRHKCEHWSVGYSHTLSDCLMALTLRIETDPMRFFKAITRKKGKIRLSEQICSYADKWWELRDVALKEKDDFIKICGWSELKAFSYMLTNLPARFNLSLSNGTPIRYAQLITRSLPHAEYCNRGVSGIDGSLSTAIGEAKAYKGVTILITGDLSMSYDIGALAIRDIPDTMKIVVIDNGGGGLFRFIPSTSALEEREEYFCAPPLLPLRQLAEGFGWEYAEVDNVSRLDSVWDTFMNAPRKSILKIICDGIISAEILKKYMQIKTKLNKI